MKHKKNIDISFAGTQTESSNEVITETVTKTEAEVVTVDRNGKAVEVVIEETPEIELRSDFPDASFVTLSETPVSNEDAYVTAVEALFAGYQAFQEGMQLLQKVQNPRFLFSKLMPVLEGFQASIAQFNEAQYHVPTEYQAGQDLLLEGIQKYTIFLVEYPIVLTGKGGLKAMKKVTKLGKLSADADQDFKKAFRAFDEATQGV